MDIAATPYLIEDATKAAAPARADPRPPRGHAAARAGPPRHRLRLPRPPRPRRARPSKAQEAQDPRAGVHPAVPPHVPARLDGLAAARHASAPTATASAGSSTRFNKQLHGSDGERKLVKDAIGKPIEMRDTTAGQARPDRQAHARREPAGPGRAGARARSAQKWQPKGATAIVMDPNSGAILALANWPRVNANDARRRARRRARRTARSASTTSRARPSRRSPSPPRWRTARSRRTRTFNIPPVLQFSDRQIHDAEDARLRDLHDAARSSSTPRTSARC